MLLPTALDGGGAPRRRHIFAARAASTLGRDTLREHPVGQALRPLHHLRLGLCEQVHDQQQRSSNTELFR